MKKLFKLFLLFTFAITSFFLTGCNNNDDYDYWKNTNETNSVLLRVGIPVNALRNGRAAVDRSVVIAGVPFKYTDSASGVDYFSGYIPRSVIYQALNYLKFQIDSQIFYVESNFFKVALSTVSSGGQPNALLSFDQEYRVLKAESNGVEVEKPVISQEEPKAADGLVELSINGDTITAVVPSEFGNVTRYYSWELRLTSNKSRNSRIMYSGQYSDMYTITSSGNNFFFTITPTGKTNLDSNTTYIGNLVSVVVYTDKSGDKPLTLTSNNTIYYQK
ncbi:MAG: hypothetical protein IKO19_01335 [Candidatus Riflebacteria bacterium]|nr:hypothetical protein [Candidatus Riflebacteria bacterium]